MKSPLLKDKIPILEFWDYWIDYWSKDCEGWEGVMIIPNFWIITKNTNLNHNFCSPFKSQI